MQAFALQARRRFLDFLNPGVAKLFIANRLPVAVLKQIGGDVPGLERTDQFEPRYPFAIIIEDAAARAREGRPGPSARCERDGIG